jgi:hypothetical protein
LDDPVETARSLAEFVRALIVAIVALPYYKETNPCMMKGSKYALRKVLADQKQLA